jgi:CRISPR-associated protein Cas1
LAHAVITAHGCSPGLGFIHLGHECTLVNDIADLYKAEITIPIAFEIASEAPEDLSGVVRRRVRDEIASEHLLERMVKDIHTLLQKDDEEGQTVTEADVTYLWDAKKGTVVNGRNYSEER